MKSIEELQKKIKETILDNCLSNSKKAELVEILCEQIEVVAENNATIKLEQSIKNS